MRNTLVLFFALLTIGVFAQTADTTYISADQAGKLYRTTVTTDPATGRKTTVDDPITDTVEQLNIYRSAYTQEITRRLNDYNVVFGYKNQISQVIKNANAVEEQFMVFMLDTTGIQSLHQTSWNLLNHPTEKNVHFRIVPAQVDAAGKITRLPILQWSFTKAAGTWKRVEYVPGFLRLVGFEEAGFVDFFTLQSAKNTTYVTLSGNYRLTQPAAANR